MPLRALPPPMATPRLVVLACLLVVCPGATARADWVVTAFFGVKFLGETTLVDLDEATGQRKPAYGVAVAFLPEGWIGAEVEIGRIPGYFQRPGGELVTRSGVTTATGTVVLAVPIAITRESLRPYLSAGLGLLRASSDDVLDIFVFRTDMLGLSVGGGALGFFSERVGVRFDLRYFKSLDGGSAAPGVGFGTPRLTFWRFGLGLLIGY